MKAFPIFCLLLFFLTATLVGQQTARYVDGGGQSVVLPSGDTPFADEIVAHFEGYLGSSGFGSKTYNALGKPDRRTLPLGCGGELVIEFLDNGLVDQEGADLHIFGSGSMSAAKVFVSENGYDWIRIGVVVGRNTSLDLKGKVELNTVFHFVRIMDLKQRCSGSYQGAHVDAVAAISSVTDKQEIAPALNPAEDRVLVRNRVVEVTIWDNKEEDGDLVEVLLNNEIIFESQAVKREGVTFELTLSEGDNLFEIKALNMGEIEPNTAALSIKDGKKEYKTILNSKIGESKSLILRLEPPDK